MGGAIVLGVLPGQFGEVRPPASLPQDVLELLARRLLFVRRGALRRGDEDLAELHRLPPAEPPVAVYIVVGPDVVVGNRDAGGKVFHAVRRVPRLDLERFPQERAIAVVVGLDLVVADLDPLGEVIGLEPDELQRDLLVVHPVALFDLGGRYGDGVLDQVLKLLDGQPLALAGLELPGRQPLLPERLLVDVPVEPASGLERGVARDAFRQLVIGDLQPQVVCRLQQQPLLDQLLQQLAPEIQRLDVGGREPPPGQLPVGLKHPVVLPFELGVGDFLPVHLGDGDHPLLASLRANPDHDERQHADAQQEQHQPRSFPLSQHVKHVSNAPRDTRMARRTVANRGSL